MNITLFDDQFRTNLFPFTHTRTAAHIRVGILTIEEKWQKHYGASVNIISEPYLNAVLAQENNDTDIYVNSRVIPNDALVQAVKDLAINELLTDDDIIIAFRSNKAFTEVAAINLETIEGQAKSVSVPYLSLSHPWDIFHLNEEEIKSDFSKITKGRSSASMPSYVTVVNPENIFVEEGVKLSPCILNASNGPIYLGRNAEIMDGAIVRGTMALCDNATIKMGAKIYEATTIGPGCKVGGEVQNVVFFGNANKGHDGYLGNAVIGEWCNLGADTNCSNLKNDYGMVKVYSEAQDKVIDTGLQFCGLLMGDHSKCAINTAFNTGTVVGVSANIFGASFPPTFIPSFSWGGAERMITYRLKSGIDTANRMMGRRKKSLSEAEEQMMAHIFELTKAQRKN